MGRFRILWLTLLSCLTAIDCASAKLTKADICGYESCNLGKQGYINVHMLAHSHDDVGWLKTVDQYYYGSRTNIQQAGVQYIIDSVITELNLDPSRRFIQVETAFFHQWWLEQNELTKELVRKLVRTGQLEFINGGWCMSDEAATHYVDLIDQMTLGLSVLSTEFGECGRPRVAWQIDPFGHSREYASLVAQMGYDGLFFGRLDYQDKIKRIQDQKMEMLWRGSQSLGEDANLFTGVLYNLYQNPPGFCFDIVCQNQPIIDDPNSKDYNLDKKVDDFLEYCQKQKDAYQTDEILLTMGGDFTYQDANHWYKNMDKIINAANARQIDGSKFNLFYSTPSCYVKALNEANQVWPVKNDDFFPYGSDKNSYWTGYFTSRPSSKFMIRQGSNLLQSCKQAATFLALSGSQNAGDYSILKEEMAVTQHHDAVTGTEKQHVADDYHRRLDIGVVECHKTMASQFKKELPLNGEELPDITFCKLLNTSACDVTENSNRFVVNVYNSLAKSTNRYIRLPVVQGTYNVYDYNRNKLTSQLVPLPTYVLNLPGRVSNATHELVFLAAQLPPVGFKSYYVQRTATQRRLKKPTTTRRNRFADTIISNERLEVTVDGPTGRIKSIKVSDRVIPLQQEFLWYEGFIGDNYSPENRSSGAYIFRPTSDGPHNVSTLATVVGIHSGPLVQEIHQIFGSWIGQTIRLYQGEDHVEFDWTVGPVPKDDLRSREIVSRFTSTLKSSSQFFTDANGRQNVLRFRNFRESWQYNITELVSGNYYPINSHIFLHDNEIQMTLVNDRAQGGSSLLDGQLELMVHRRLLHDDAFGVGEPLSETQFGRGLVARGTHFLILSNTSDAAHFYRPLAQHLNRHPLISFITTDKTLEEWSTQYKMQAQWVKTLPENINLLTLEPRPDGKLLIRLEHMFDVDEDNELSAPVTISITDLLTNYTITEATELMLGGNQLKNESSRFTWQTADSNDFIRMNAEVTGKSESLALDSIVMSPMQIRTFSVTAIAN